MKDKKSISCQARGFTLVELLVVSVVIALLLGLLAPALGAAREQARQVCCAAKLKGVGMALATYVSEQNQHLPVVVEPLWTATAIDWNADPADAAANPGSLMNALRKYVPAALLTCPAAVLGYPSNAYAMTYRASAANNYDGLIGSVFNADGSPKYAYSLKYLDGRKYETKYVRAGTFPLQLTEGTGPYYLLRDFVAKGTGAGGGGFVMPHGQNFNQLYLDFSVSLARDPTFGLTYP